MAKKTVKKINQDKIDSFLRKVEQNNLEIREKEAIAPVIIDNPTSEQVYSELKKGECTLFFYKMTDGSSRRMRCTLDQNNFSEKLRDLLLSIFHSYHLSKIIQQIQNNATSLIYSS